MKVCLVCSPGGHFDEMTHLLEAVEGHDCFLVTYESESVGQSKNSSLRVYLIKSRYLKNAKSLFGLSMLILATALAAVKIIVKEKPSTILSTGGGEIAVPFCYLGKMLGKRVIFVEPLSNIYSKSGGGKFVYPIANLFLVQWQSMLKLYGGKAQYWGKVI